MITPNICDDKVEFDKLFRNPNYMDKSYGLEIRDWITRNYKKIQKKNNMINMPFVRNNFECKIYAYSVVYNEDLLYDTTIQNLCEEFQPPNDTSIIQKIKLVDNYKNVITIKEVHSNVVICNSEGHNNTGTQTFELLEYSGSQSILKIKYNGEPLRLTDDFEDDLCDLMFTLLNMFCIVKSNMLEIKN